MRCCCAFCCCNCSSLRASSSSSLFAAILKACIAASRLLESCVGRHTTGTGEYDQSTRLNQVHTFFFLFNPSHPKPISLVYTRISLPPSLSLDLYVLHLDFRQCQCQYAPSSHQHRSHTFFICSGLSAASAAFSTPGWLTLLKLHNAIQERGNESKMKLLRICQGLHPS